LVLSKIIKTVATSCQILRLKCTKFDFGSLRSRWGSSQRSPRPLPRTTGPTSKGRAGQGREGQGDGQEERRGRKDDRGGEEAERGGEE